MSNVGQKELNVNKSSVKTVYILVGPKGSGKTFIGNALEDRWRIRGSRIISTSTVRSLVGDWTQSVNTIRVNSRRFDTQSTTSLGLRVVGSINKR
jgi:adenylylsulfate kinase-like enzyme